jgi:hypothetical protein
VAHFHYVMSLGAVFAIFAGIYFWIGKMSGRQYPEWAGKLHFWMMFIGSNLTFFPQHFLGRQGMPRRYIDYPEAFAYWNYISSIGAFLSFASFVFFIGIVFYTLPGKRVTENNYWNEYADTLEWTLPSPPPEHTFEQLPKRPTGTSSTRTELAGVWWALNRSYRDAEIVEDLALWPDRMTLVRHGPRGRRQEWEANPHWVRVTLHRSGGPVPNYLTLQGGPREVELGAFLSEDERIALRDELYAALEKLR